MILKDYFQGLVFNIFPGGELPKSSPEHVTGSVQDASLTHGSQLHEQCLILFQAVRQCQKLRKMTERV